MQESSDELQRSKEKLALVRSKLHLMTNRIIKEVHKRPPLWDTKCDDYTDAELKKKLWMELANICLNKTDRISRRSVQVKWKNIRDCYVKAYKAYIKGTARKPKNGERLKFLIPHIKSRTTAPLDSIQMSADEEDPAEDNKIIGMVDNDDEIEILKVERKDTDDEESEEACFEPELIPHYQFVETPPNKCDRNNSDETENFFLSLAKTVKRLKPYNQAILKKTIANIVYDAEIKEASSKK